MKMCAVAFCLLSVLAVGKTALAKSSIFDKVSSGSSIDVGKNYAMDDFSNLRTNTHKRTQRKRSPYGLVYNQGKPIGILEPISQSFEYSAYNNNPMRENDNKRRAQWFPAKRDADDADLQQQSPGGIHSSNYANVLAKFKQVKRETSQTTNHDQDAAVQNEPNMEEKIVGIEENLKEVMNDMGLVGGATNNNNNNKNEEKREIYYEDEDLENGLNKIGLTKSDRNKKENCPGKTKVKSKAGKRQQQQHKNVTNAQKKKQEDESESDDAKRSVGHRKANVANYQSEGEAFIRSKRQEASDVMKDLEQSGDLTVSGNKSPLVAVTSGEDSDAKKSQEKRDREELEYEKRLERGIQEKINAIKEEVKREIGKFKNGDRKKREIANTLLDEETSVLDPGLNIDQKLEPYVRKRRDLEKQEGEKKRENQEKKKETRDSINEIANAKLVEKRSEINAELEADQNLVKNLTKRSQEEEDLGKRKLNEAELATGKTIIDFEESDEATPEKRDSDDSLDQSQRNQDDTEDDTFGQKRNSLMYPNLDVDRNTRKLFDKESRLERNSNDDDANIYRQNRKKREDFYRWRRKRDDDPDFLGRYRADNDGEIDDEGDEMDDDGFNDQTSNFLDKRQAGDYEQEDEDESNYDEDYPSFGERSKRNSEESDEVYPSSKYRRQKREDFAQRLAAHGGETALNHLTAVRDRNMKAIEKNYRRKRLEGLNKIHSQKQNIVELSESDIFGGLPQSYEGELSRFKRVKRQI